MSITINADGSATFDTIEEAVAYAMAIAGAQTTTVPTKTETSTKTNKAVKTVPTAWIKAELTKLGAADLVEVDLGSKTRKTADLTYRDNLTRKQKKTAKKAIHMLGAKGYGMVDGKYMWRVCKDQHDPDRVERANKAAWYYSLPEYQRKVEDQRRKEEHAERNAAWKAAHPETETEEKVA